MNSYDVGTQVRVSATFTSIGGSATDPGAVTVTVSKPDGTTANYSGVGVVRDSTGNYHCDLDTTGWPGGVIGYKFAGTTPAQVVSDTTFYLRDPGF